MKFDELLDNYPIPFFVIKPIYNDKNEMINFSYVFINEAFARFLGKAKSEMIHNDFVSLFGTDYEIDWMIFFDKVIKSKSYVAETRFTSVISRTIVIESFYIRPNLCASFIRDYFTNSNGKNSYKQINADVLNKAYYDYMTNFYNINYLNEHMSLIEKSENIGLVYLDINGLKKTNSELGHAAGDQLILKFANFIRNNFVGNDFFRLGGDEFLIIVMGLNKEKFEALCNKSKEELDNNNMAAIGFNYYENISSFEASLKEVEELMRNHKKEMKRKNAKK